VPRSALVLPLLLAALAAPAAAQTEVRVGHGIAMHGDLRYPADFRHFAYADPSAPKGGLLRQAEIGTFDSFNAFIIKGNPAASLGLIYDTLLVHSHDEPFSMYGLLAERIETPQDRSWVIFRLRETARWHDGTPVTADDVIWSFQTLVEKGAPLYRVYWANVARVEKLGPRAVKFHFSPGENRELPLILGQLTVLPKHWWQAREFDKTTLDPPLGSGPYRIAGFEPGRFVSYERVPDYWARDLAVKVGHDNFDSLRFDYYRDETVAIEALKGDEFDLRVENSSKEWATAYEVPDVSAGRLVKAFVRHDRPAGMQGFAFNTRRSLFRDPRVRRALGYAFDFEWSNATLFYGQYTRTRSYFDNSELAATGLPGPRELSVLVPRRGRIPDEVFTREYQPPRTDGTGVARENLRTAAELLKQAGWVIRDMQLRHEQTGEAMEFEVLLVSPAFERIVLPFAKNLERIGVKASVRTVDTSQYRRRIDAFDFDVTVFTFGQSNSPGNEQRDFWGSAAARRPGSRNVIGIEDPAVDELVELLIASPDRDTLVARTRALDRVLQWSHYVIPQWHIDGDRIVYWNRFGRPAITPSSGVQIDTWWFDAERAAALARARSGGS
jgi:microcin C transport system substrate-binding protein